ncbi:MAG: hypothetical protein R2712_25250 [Vicinamibacterales bacterium]
MFGHLYCRDVSGRTWLPDLLSLVQAQCPPLPKKALKSADWWPRERALHAPPGLLRWLIANCTAPRDEALGTGDTRRKREALVRRDPETVSEALRLLSGMGAGRNWYTLEGPSQPDAFVEADEFVVVIEGKRTESAPTTKTEWMPVRHQMLRHLDAAWEIREQRPVVGLMIVEGENGGGTLPAGYRDYRESLEGGTALDDSLPHRTKEERAVILQAFAGVTTWRAVLEALRVPDDVLIPQLSADGV